MSIPTLADYETLTAQEDFAGIVERFEANAPYDGLPEGFLLVMNALNHLGVSKAYQALSLLEATRPLLGNDPEWTYQYALSHIAVESPHRAVPYLAKIPEHKDAFARLTEITEQIESLDVGETSADRVLNMWKDFVKEADHIEELWKKMPAVMPKNSISRITPPGLADELLHRLQTLFHRSIKDAIFSIENRHPTPYFLFDMPRDKASYILLMHMFLGLPSELMQRWQFQLGITYTPGQHLNINELPIDSVEVWLEPMEGYEGFFRLWGYSPLLRELSAKNDLPPDVLGSLQDIFEQMVTTEVGSIAAVRTLQRITLLPEPPTDKGSSIPLAKLADELQRRGAVLDMEFTDYMDEMMAYERKPNLSPQSLRDDIVKGYISVPSMLRQWEEDITPSFDTFVDNGALPVMFALPLRSNGLSLDPDEQLAFGEKLAEAVTELVGHGVFQKIGVAAGRDCLYVDAVLWHPNYGYRGFAQVARELGMKAVLIQPFSQHFRGAWIVKPEEVDASPAKTQN